ncbi:hypothetical protein K2173_015934 [Erythroxylum novogranatense]|uniref:Pectinesterase inhibitor domain-containing protein n=1 Tax=Erythroxylum novogranatense TaxID=1862640 RepID=A0AAV8SFH8_9ROSI|nr:hypothetical protein K2173_015934 [Erythroxylum novogranatense]
MGFPKMIYSVDRLPLLLFLVTFTFMANPAISVLNNGEDLVSTACNHTLYVELCESSLRSDPRSKTWDLQGLASIALNINIANGVRTRDRIHSLKSTADNKTLSGVNVCSEEYSDAVQNLQEAIGALRNRSFDSVNTLVSSAMTDSETCEEGFEVEMTISDWKEAHTCWASGQS